MLSGQTCLFAVNYNHLNFPRAAPIWPCSSVGTTTVLCFRDRGFESHQGQRLFSLSPPCRPISFLGLLHCTLLYSPLLSSPLLSSPLLSSPLLSSPLLCSFLLCSTLRYFPLLHSTLLCSALLYSTLLSTLYTPH